MDDDTLKEKIFQFIQKVAAIDLDEIGSNDEEHDLLFGIISEAQELAQ